MKKRLTRTLIIDTKRENKNSCTSYNLKKKNDNVPPRSQVLIFINIFGLQAHWQKSLYVQPCFVCG